MTPWTADQARRDFASAPVVDLERLCAPGPILIAAPHPDDESLGCGGLIALAAEAGRGVVVAILTDGAGSHPGSLSHPPACLAALREGEAREAVRELAGKNATLALFGAPDGRLDEREAGATGWLSALVARHGCATVVAPWEADPHPDHKATFRAAATAARERGAALLAYPVWGLTLADGAPAGGTAPCVRLDVARVVARKARAIAAHKSQTTTLIQDDPHGFRLTPEDLARHAGPWETYLRASPATSIGSAAGDDFKAEFGEPSDIESLSGMRFR